ncbi:MAG: ABC transporter ATP-binding protein [Oligoflexus sp.]
MSAGIYRTFAHNVMQHWGSYLAGTLALLITSLTEVLMPKFIQWTIDLLTNKDTTTIPSWFHSNTMAGSLDRLVGFFILSLIIGWIGRIGWRQLLARRTHEAGHKLKTKFWSTLKDQPLTFLHRYPLGDLMNRATADWNKTRFIYGFTMVMTFDIVFFSLLALVSMFLIDVQLALACLLLLPFLPKPIIRLSKREYAQHQKAQEHLSELSDAISQAVNTVRLQRATNSEAIWENQLAKRASRYAWEQFQVLKIGWKIFILGALPTIAAYAVLFSFGIYKLQIGDISIGQFIALQSYVLLLQSPLFELGSVISEWQTGFASFARILEIFGFETKPKTTNHPPISHNTASDEAINIEQLSFRYSEDLDDVLNDINLTVKRGEKIGITGPIGSGKTTLVQILTGLSEHYRGHLSLFEIPMPELGRDWLSQNIAVVPQKPFLFAGSIRSNLTLDREFSDEQMIQALQIVRLWDDIQDMPHGLDTWIGEWGINLSGGQKQRLAIARALLRPTAILILDDCLSAVDSVTEEFILDKLQSLFQGQTLIWTAHRASTLQLCDRIFQLNQGYLQELVSKKDRPASAGLRLSSQLEPSLH